MTCLFVEEVVQRHSGCEEKLYASNEEKSAHIINL